MNRGDFPVIRHTFRKPERLVSRKIIEQLIAKGRSVQGNAFRIVWSVHALGVPFPIQIAFSVPKRNFRSAVDRNRIKRLMREYYRQNKEEIYSLVKGKDLQVALLLVYTGKTIPGYQDVVQKMSQTLKHFVEDFQKHSG